MGNLNWLTAPNRHPPQVELSALIVQVSDPFFIRREAKLSVGRRGGIELRDWGNFFRGQVEYMNIAIPAKIQLVILRPVLHARAALQGGCSWFQNFEESRLLATQERHTPDADLIVPI